MKVTARRGREQILGVVEGAGVFRHLVDRAAFIDRVDLSLRGKRRRRPLGSVSIDRRFAIGSEKSVYGRATDGTCVPTENPFQLKYGVLRWPRRVPPMRLTLRSQQTPLSGAQAELVSNAFLCRGFKSQVSRVEMTFDLTGTSVNFFRRNLQSTARRFRTVTDARGWKTFYVGGPRSHWQLRIYQKQSTVVRFEFTFRIAFLRRWGIRRPHELVLLRNIDLTRLVWLREVNESKLLVSGEKELEDYQNRAIRRMAQFLSANRFSKWLKECRIFRPELFVPCSLEAKLRRLQRRLLW